MRGSEIRDLGWKRFYPGWKKIGSGMAKFGSGIRDKHPGSATLFLGTRRRYRYIVKRLLCATEVKQGRQFLPFSKLWMDFCDRYYGGVRTVSYWAAMSFFCWFIRCFGSVFICRIRIQHVRLYTIPDPGC
jgi:hypothetical protein